MINSKPAPATPVAATATAPETEGFLGFNTTEWKRIGAMAVFFVFAAIFWGAYEQAGSTLDLSEPGRSESAGVQLSVQLVRRRSGGVRDPVGPGVRLAMDPSGPL